MALNITATNTTVKRAALPGWVRIIHDTGAKDDDGNPVVLTATVTQASIERSAGVLLPRAAIKGILKAALEATQGSAETDLAGAL